MTDKAITEHEGLLTWRALALQERERVKELEAEVERLEGELADCAKTCGGLEYRLRQAEGLQ